ncbi:RagB/SusD family nutrient uptake outer membrane protein [Pedobacter miscanthi]|uniref:RagB/SusD family nutrient uptake outer membrane protein n=1 Tax=Pedobacter miscanthi TaxID=2259170 RepID=A0A366KLP1_9SPHI|nr:RagB/SusD family nutrient uptake outer membrane protein [Pedobacter miscanthi]RBQ02440.1 RagB/SusD family nutrient uptake outer membrane protein [Pedobacter miscanthi]
MKNSFKYTGQARLALMLITLLTTFGGCKKLIENNASGGQLLDKEVYKDSTTVKGALAGMYSSLITNNRYSVLMSGFPGYSADELTNYNLEPVNQFVLNSILTTNTEVNNNLWSAPYSVIYAANAIIENVPAGSNLTPKFQAQSIAEARFIRAFCYFYLINLFGDVPLVTTTDVDANKTSPRSPEAAVYSQITDDLLFAQANLPASYILSAGARTRANKWAATALLARTYLYQGNWAAAETQATSLLDNTALFGLEDLNRIFVPTSKEAILQLYNDASGINPYASAMLPSPTAPTIPKYVFTEQLKNAYAAETGDARRTAWTITVTAPNAIVYTCPAKYKGTTPGNAEYFTLFRLGEQYLIRAEARAQLNNLTGSRADLLMIRQRAGLGATPANDKNALLLAVERERRIELSCEMGHRWFDLKRTARANTVLGAVKPTWKPEAALYPIPADQRSRNGNLTQNPGYIN